MLADPVTQGGPVSDALASVDSQFRLVSRLGPLLHGCECGTLAKAADALTAGIVLQSGQLVRIEETKTDYETGVVITPRSDCSIGDVLRLLEMANPRPADSKGGVSDNTALQGADYMLEAGKRYKLVIASCRPGQSVPGSNVLPNEGGYSPASQAMGALLAAAYRELQGGFPEDPKTVGSVNDAGDVFRGQCGLCGDAIVRTTPYGIQVIPDSAAKTTPAPISPVSFSIQQKVDEGVPYGC